MHILIAGSSGSIGNYFMKRYKEEKIRVSTLNRSNGTATWNQPASIQQVIDEADVVINLAGAPINVRQSPENKKILIDSRVETTNKLAYAIAHSKTPPQLWINASGAHIYGTQDALYTEAASIDTPTEFFASILARKWEEAFFSTPLPHTRQIALRFPIVLNKNGGVFPILSKLSNFYLGGKQGSGKQAMSWIHIEDLFQIVQYCISNKKLTGAINASHPEVVSNTAFMATLREVLKVPFGIAAPSFGIQVVSSILGMDASLVLNHLSVSPKVLESEHYNYQFPSLKAALMDLVKK
jgi:uncharacterized protein (TIGR01777 family)